MEVAVKRKCDDFVCAQVIVPTRLTTHYELFYSAEASAHQFTPYAADQLQGMALMPSGL
jgi:hypothetical protein